MCLDILPNAVSNFKTWLSLLSSASSYNMCLTILSSATKYRPTPAGWLDVSKLHYLKVNLSEKEGNYIFPAG